MGWTTPHAFAVGEILTAANMNLMQDNINYLFGLQPVGTYRLTVQVTSGSGVENVVDTNWLECNGAAVSRTTYAALFTKANSGGWFGAGNGSTTYNLPNFRGRAPWMDDGGASFGMGGTGGEINHTLSVGEMAVHNHGVTDPTHAHALAGGASAYASGTGQTGPNAANSATFVTATAAASTGISIGNSGSGNAHNNMPPYQTAGIWVVKFQ